MSHPISFNTFVQALVELFTADINNRQCHAQFVQLRSLAIQNGHDIDSLLFAVSIDLIDRQPDSIPAIDAQLAAVQESA